MIKLLAVICLGSLLAGIQGFADETNPGKIPEAEMFPVEQSYAAAASQSSNTLKRRAYKKVVRSSKTLLKQYPESNDRYQLLNIIFKCQQNLMMINNTQENRDDVFATAREIVKAPMEFSKIRLQPDILLLRAKMAAGDMTLEARLKSIKEMAELYFESDAEATCLMHLTLIAKDLEDHEVFEELKLNLSSRFAQDAEVVAFLRERFKVSKRDMRFRGTFRTLKGKTIRFPGDLIGHNYLVCFWSTKTPDIQKRFALIKEYQEKTNGHFKIFSFNLDELEDAGQSVLTANSLDWKAMHLPKGINSKAFLGYGHAKSLYTLIPCNAMGYSLGKTYNSHTKHESDVDVYAILNGTHYLSLMQALSSGHFLISESDLYATGKLKTIQSHFPGFQHRYRLKNREVLEHYQKAITLCDEFIKSNTDSEDLWKVRNAKIIAHLGIWKADLSPDHLNLAVEEAKLALAAKDLTAAAKVIPQFCLAKNALRQDDANTNTSAEAVITNFVDACGGDQATSSAYAAAVVLAVDGGQDTRDLYRDYRYTILDKYSDDKTILPVTSYLLKKLDAKYLFQANEKRYYFGYTSIYAHERSENVRHSYLHRKMNYEFTTVSGKKLSIPDEQQYHYHLCAFLDLPKNAEAEAQQKELLTGLMATVGECRRKDMKLVLFFLSQDTKAINDLLAKYQLDCDAVSLPDGIDHPILNQLGIYSPEHFANTSLMSPNGTFLVNYSKLHHQGTVIHRHDKDKNPWFNCMSSYRVSTSLKNLTVDHDTRMGDFYYHKAQGVQTALFDEGSCCLFAYQRGWTGCRKDCCRKAISKGGVCLLCNPGAKGKKPIPATPNDWKLAARYLALTFNDNEKHVQRTSQKLKVAMGKSKDYKAMLAYLNEAIKNHKKPYYGIYRFPWEIHLERAAIYDKLGEKGKAAADRKYAAELKIKDDAAVAKLNKGKKDAIENRKKKAADEIKAAQERIKKLKEAEAKNESRKGE